MIVPRLINPIPSTDVNAIVPNIGIPVKRTSPCHDLNEGGTFESTSTSTVTTTLGSLEKRRRFNDDDRTRSTSNVQEILRYSMIKRKITNHQGINAEDDEVIDVERLDDGDPMWRPW